MRKIAIGIIIGVLLYVVPADAFLFKKKQPPIYLTAAELANYDGREGQPLYVAVEGKIYDLSKCRYWRKGIHIKSPDAAIGGRDLTEVLKTSKHGIKRVQRYPHVGFLVESKEDAPVESNVE